ncbi:MAG: hypothetical protein K9J16_02455 [Melioribacteraceae bacterium]|nr:hypothetical protein [Melioribacteraceae bacterium]MCF8353760.1 hypothetical protein [Melioribacteraceae bacterium]MCF8392430.1 hypothetical protein [Melioribacteraceae bacterium]MCF8418342.1 hypothetical protein [Melioribacteraceae bacterium]
MSLANQYITSESEDFEQINNKLIESKFRNISKRIFNTDTIQDVEFVDFLKYSYKFFSLNLPSEIGELFISKEIAPYVLVADHPVFVYAEDLIKSFSKTAIYSYEETKKYYSKWLNIKNEKEKQYFALSTLNLLEKDRSSQNFLKYILYAIVLSYDKRMYSPEKSIKMMEQAIAVFRRLNISDEYRNEINYLLSLYYGFIHLRRYDLENANSKFIDAAVIKSHGISALFYNGLMENLLGKSDKSIGLLSEVLSVDKRRIGFAIKTNNLGLFTFFTKATISQNIFREKGFVNIAEELNYLFNSFLNDDERFFAQLNNKMNGLDLLKIKDFYDDQIISDLEFIKKFITKYEQDDNLFVQYSYNFIAEKFNNILDTAKANIKKKYQNEITDEIRVYDNQIKSLQDKITYKQKEAEDGNAALNQQLEKSLSRIDKVVKERIDEIEFKIEHLELDKKYDPRNTFSSSLVNTLVISLMVLTIGGFANGIMSNGEVYNVSEIISEVFISGMKWGLITLVLGIIISFFSSVSVVWDRLNNKQRLLKEISYLKNYKEKEISSLKTDAERKKKVFQEKIKSKIENLQKELEFVKHDKNEKFEEFNEKTSAEISNYEQEISGLYLN